MSSPFAQRKHILRHLRPFKCDQQGCKRVTNGFSTRNDLDRHKKSVHRIAPSKGTVDRTYVCAVPNCNKREKVWPRADNFKVCTSYKVPYNCFHIIKVQALFGLTDGTTYSALVVHKVPHQFSPFMRVFSEEFSEEFSRLTLLDSNIVNGYTRSKGTISKS